MELRVEHVIGLHDIADALMGDFQNTAQLLILMAADCGPGDALRLRETINTRLAGDDGCRPDLRRLGELLVKAADSA